MKTLLTILITFITLVTVAQPKLTYNQFDWQEPTIFSDTVTTNAHQGATGTVIFDNDGYQLSILDNLLGLPAKHAIFKKDFGSYVFKTGVIDFPASTVGSMLIIVKRATGDRSGVWLDSLIDVNIVADSVIITATNRGIQISAGAAPVNIDGTIKLNSNNSLIELGSGWLFQDGSNFYVSTNPISPSLVRSVIITAYLDSLNATSEDNVIIGDQTLRKAYKIKWSTAIGQNICSTCEYVETSFLGGTDVFNGADTLIGVVGVGNGAGSGTGYAEEVTVVGGINVGTDFNRLVQSVLVGHDLAGDTSNAFKILRIGINNNRTGAGIFDDTLTALIGFDLTATKDSQMVFGAGNMTTILDLETGIFTVQKFQMTDGVTNNYVLTSDASGNATWGENFSSKWTKTTNKLSPTNDERVILGGVDFANTILSVGGYARFLDTITSTYPNSFTAINNIAPGSGKGFETFVNQITGDTSFSTIEIGQNGLIRIEVTDQKTPELFRSAISMSVNDDMDFIVDGNNFDFISTTGTIVMPRMTATQAITITPEDGMMLYVTDTDATFTHVGFWSYENTTWVSSTTISAFSSLWYHGAELTTTIITTDSFHQITSFENIGLEDNSGHVVGDPITDDDITINLAGAYGLKVSASFKNASGSNKNMMITPKIIFASAKTITGATNATPIVITSAAHGFLNGDMVNISGVGGNTAANGDFAIENVATNTFELQILGFVDVVGNGAYTSGGTIDAYYPGELALMRVVSGTDLGRGGANGHVELAVGDILELHVANTSDTNNFILNQVSFCVKIID